MLSKTQMQQKNVISRVSGPDLTSGSCASVALAYIGNKCGYNVLDFRGGESRNLFATPSILRNMTKAAGSMVESERNEFNTAFNLLRNVQQGKEYFFFVGEHAAIIRRTQTGLEYLELQGFAPNNKSVNEFLRCGYHPLTRERLMNRFKCKTSRIRNGINITCGGGLVEISQLCKDKGFKRLLEFINTKSADQQKGAGGSTR